MPDEPIDNQAAVELAAWVDEIADRFEAAWRTFKAPPIEDYVEEAAGARRTLLLAELVKLDLAYRRQLSQPCHWEDYLRRFPELQQIARGGSETPSLSTPEPESGAPATTPLATVCEPALPHIQGYELLGELGRGGMGVVYKARQLRLNRVVALKMILPAACGGPQARARFLAEAGASARLQHPNIVQIYEIGEQDGQPFLALECVDGLSLARRMAATPQPPRPAAWLVAALARAVQHAHEQGIVHRDIKPGNVLLAGGTDRPLDQCNPKITDFGLAKQLPGEATPSEAEPPGYQTQTGEILGTPSYMAPEQAEGNPRAIGVATDVYALGAILYDLLVGRPPFQGATVLDTLEQVRSQEPVPPSRLQPGLPRDLETICLKCLHKDPGQRYAGAGQLADDLQRFLDGRPIQARPVGPVERFWRWCRRNPLVASLSLAALLFFVAAFAGTTYFAVAENARAREADLAKLRALRESALLALQRGRHLAELGDGGRGLLWLARSLELAAEADDPDLSRVVRINLAGVTGQHTLRWIFRTERPLARCVMDSNGKKVWTSSRGGKSVQGWDIASGQPGPKIALDQSEVMGLALSADGKVLFTGGEKQSRLWDTDTLRSREPPLRHQEGVLSAAFGPGDDVLVTGHAMGRAWLWEVSTGRPRAELRGHSHDIWGVAFSPDGRTVATGSVDDTIRLWDAATGKPLGQPIPIKGQVWSLAWSPDRQTLLVGNAQGLAQFVDAGTGQRRGQALAHQNTVTSVAFSRDGRIVATGSGDQTARLRDTATGKAIGNILPHGGAVRSTCFSADARVLATASDDGQVRVWELASTRAVLPHRSWVYAAAFSSDGRLALTGCGDHTARLWDVATGQAWGEPFQHPNEVCAVAFRGDGKSFFSGCWTGHIALWEPDRHKSGRMFRAHQTGPCYLAVSPDGRALASGGGDGMVRLWDAATLEPRGEPGRHGGPVVAVAFSADGRTLLSGSEDKTARLWDVASGKSLGAALAHPAPVKAVAFSQDGSRFFTGCLATVRTWDAATRKAVGQPLSLERNMTSMALTPDDRTILAGTTDGKAQLFDVATNLPLGAPFAHGKHVEAVALSPDCRTALTAARGPNVRLWPVPGLITGDVQRIGLWVQVISGLELTDDGLISVLDGAAWQERKARLDRLGGAPKLP